MTIVHFWDKDVQNIIVINFGEEEPCHVVFDNKAKSEEPGWYEGMNKDESLEEDLKSYKNLKVTNQQN